jgi:hypothetical protein
MTVQDKIEILQRMTRLLAMIDKLADRVIALEKQVDKPKDM